MFYEGRIQTIKQFESLESMLSAIKAQFDYSIVYCFQHNGQLLGLANDASSCEAITEAAVLNLTTMKQTESVTLDWLKSDWLDYFSRLFNSEDFLSKTLPFSIAGNKIVSEKPRLAFFECGCCGSSFQSEYNYQLQFDQDAGYGICPSCE
jgi:hypothetical protein